MSAVPRHEKSAKIVNKRGLHARASAKLVEAAARFQSEITVTKDGQTVDARSIMGLMMLAASLGAEVEIVAYGPGLHMLREDTSPVKDRIKQLKDVSFPSNITFSACNHTKQGMEKREGHPIVIISQASIVPAGVVRIMELEEQGWSYVRP